ncbi:MAG: hypothetical protein QOJ02_2843 [Acidobacteriota bacterium]|jgi:hypothetical protein|nr:hypothetical protein [Acidobacteriota bacterium]
MHERVEISAPIEQVYAVAADPDIVPSYALEIARIDLVKRLSPHSVLARSHLKIARLTFASLYRYHYRPPGHYSGIQEDGKLLRGYFSFSFQTQDNRTVVSHTEGIMSSIPGLAAIVGFIYFRILSRGGLAEELKRLKNLVEGSRSSIT